MENPLRYDGNYAFIREGVIYREDHHLDVVVAGFLDKGTRAFISGDGSAHYQIHLRHLAELKPEFLETPHYLDVLSESAMRAVHDLAEFARTLGFNNPSRQLTDKLLKVKRFASQVV